MVITVSLYRKAPFKPLCAWFHAGEKSVETTDDLVSNGYEVVGVQAVRMDDLSPEHHQAFRVIAGLIAMSSGVTSGESVGGMLEELMGIVFARSGAVHP